MPTMPDDSRRFVIDQMMLDVGPQGVRWSFPVPTWMRAVLDSSGARAPLAMDDGSLSYAEGMASARESIENLHAIVVVEQEIGRSYMYLDREHNRVRGVNRWMLNLLLRVLPQGLVWLMGAARLGDDRQVAAARDASDHFGSLRKAHIASHYRTALDLARLYESENVYTWQIGTTQDGVWWKTALYIGMECVLAPILIFGALWALEWAAPAVAFWVAIGIAVWSLTMATVSAYNGTSLDLASLTSSAPDADPIQRALEAFETRYSLESMQRWIFRSAFALWGFAIGSEAFWFSNGFSISDPSRSAWGLYLVEAFVETLSFDIPSVLGFSLSEIEPVSAAAKLSIIALKTLMAVGVVSAIYQAVRRRTEPEAFVGSTAELVSHLMTTNYMAVGRLVLNGAVVSYAQPYVFEPDMDSGEPNDNWEPS